MVGHFDTYGAAPHNFYLYNNPETDQLTWVSWDHNMTFGKDLLAVFPVDKANVPDAWPLIRYLLDDPVYWDRYVELMAENFAIRGHAEELAPVATLDMSQEEYAAAVQTIVDFVELRTADVEEFPAEQE